MTYHKNSPQKQFVKKEAAVTPVPDFTHAEMEQAAHAASNAASLDLSVKEDVNMSDAEILKRYRTSLSNSVLPEPPSIPGFHVCWVPLSSNNRFDTVDSRKQLGYSIVKEEEVPSFISPSNRAAGLEGTVSHNELILMKVPLNKYNLYMKDSHHTQPLEQEGAIKASVDAMLVDKEGVSIKRDENEMTGMRKLARKVAEPTFT